MQLSAGLNGDTFLLQVQLSMFPCCVNDVHQLWSRDLLASCKQTGRVPAVPGKLICHMQQPQRYHQHWLQCDSFNNLLFSAAGHM